MVKFDIKEWKNNKVNRLCVPFVGKNEYELMVECDAWLMNPSDVIEWRIDYFDMGSSFEKLKYMFMKLKSLLPQAIFLLTVRTIKEGGNSKVDQQEYFDLINFLMGLPIDMIDIELSCDGYYLVKLLETAHNKKIISVLSHHDFNKTPAYDELIKTVQNMDSYDCDIIKVAFMPHDETDVLNVLRATQSCSATLDKPMITMSMGEMGLMTRLFGYQFGSVMSFASLQMESAPGQISIQKMKEIQQRLD